jgi:BirA family biotin operon repressor/biotin-[acetyl-CoA-carboxylase] ligase
MIHRFDTLGSTNEELARMAEKGAPEYTAVLAGSQTLGRGRAGRDWWSPKGNLYLSVLLRPGIQASRLPRTSILASLALFRAIGDKTGLLSLKWPNDLLLGGRKVAGILPAARTEGDKVAWIVTGVGVNLKEPDVRAPDGLDSRIAFLDTVIRISPEDLALRVISELEELDGSFEGPAWEKAREEWSHHAIFGPSYTLRDGSKVIEGVPLHLAEDGGLVMETEKGKVTVYAGELEKAGERVK